MNRDAGMGAMPVQEDAALGRTLVLDELADLSLYEALLPHAKGDIAELLATLIPIERGHYEFWKKFFHVEVTRLDFPRRLRLQTLVLLCRLFGTPAIGLTLEAIEVHGIRKYLRVFEAYKDAPLGTAVHSILEDEFKHEDAVVSGVVTQRVHPERVRDIFLGLNDGLVEMLGAISGFFAAFSSAPAVLVAGLTVTVAGALSMAAGAFMGGSSAREIEEVEAGRRRFLGEPDGESQPPSPLASAVSVGISYTVGALIPIAPVFLGGHSLLISIAVSIVAIIIISYVLAFFSGMSAARRTAINIVIIVIAVIVTYGIGTAANALFTISP